MLAEAEDSINYPEFLIQLEALVPREILETNAVEEVGSDITPLLAVPIHEPDVDWNTFRETEEKNDEKNVFDRKVKVIDADVVPDEKKSQVATGVEEPATTLGVKTSDVVMTRIEPSEEVDDEEDVLAKELFVERGIESELQPQAPNQDTVPTESSQVVAKVDLSEKDPEDFDALKDITAGDSVKLSAEITTPSDSPEATDVSEVFTEITPIDLDVAEPETADVVPDEQNPHVATGGEEPATALGVKMSDVVMTRIEPSEEVDDEEGTLAKEIFVEPGIEAELQAHAPSQDSVPTESSHAVAKVDLSEQDPEDFDDLKDITAGDSVNLSAETTTASDSPEATDVLEVFTEITPIDLDVAEPEKADVVPDEEKPQVATGVEEPAITHGVKTSEVVMTRIEPTQGVDGEEDVLAKDLFVEPGIEAELQAQAPSQDTVPTESSQAVANVDLSEQDPKYLDALKDITVGDSVKLSAESTTPSDSPEAADVLEVLTEITPIDLDVAEPEKADVVPHEEKPQVATGVEEPAITLGVKTYDVVMTRTEPSEEVDDEEGDLAKEIFVEPGIEAELQAHAPSQDTIPTESSHAVAKVDLCEQDPEDFDALKDIPAGESVKLSAETTTPSDCPEATDALTEITPIDLDVAEPEKADVVPDEEKPQVATGVEEPAITLGVKTSDVVMTRTEPSEEVDDEEGVLAKEIFVEPGIEAELQAHAPSQDTVPTESSHAVAEVDLCEQDPEDFDALKDIPAGESVKLSAETTTPSDCPEATDALTEITPIDLDVAEPEKADVVPDEEKPQVATGVEEPAITLGVKTSDVVMTRTEPSEEVDDEEGVLAKEIFVEPGIEAELQAPAPSQDTVPTESSHAVAKVDLCEQDPEDFDALKDIPAGESVKLSAETTTPSDCPEATDALTEITPIDLDVAEPEKADVVPDEEKSQVATGVEEPAITLGVKTSDVVMTRIEPTQEVDDEEDVLAKELSVEPGIEAELQAQARSQDTLPTESSQAVANVDLSEQDPEYLDALKDITAGDSVKLSAETTTPSDGPEATDVFEVLTEITPIHLDVVEPEKADVVPDEEKPQVATGVEEPAITLGVKTSDVVMTRIEPTQGVDNEDVLAKELFVKPGIEAELQAQAPSQDTVLTESSQAVANVDLSEQDPQDFDALKDITAGDSVKLSVGTTTPSDSPEATDVLEVLTEITPIDLDVAEPEKADVVPDEEKPQVATGVEEPAITLGVKTSDVVMTRIEPSEEVDDEEGVLAKEIFVEPGIEAELQAHAPSQDTVPTESSHAVAKVDLSEQDPEDFDALKDITAGDSVKLSAETTTPSDSPEATDVLEVLTEITPIHLDVAEPEKADVVPDEEKPQVATGVEEPAITLGVETSDVVMSRIEPTQGVDNEDVLAKELFVKPGIEAELQAQAPSQDTVPTESSQAVANVDLSEQDPQDFDALKDITAGDSVKLSAGTTTPSDSPEATDVLEVLTEITPIHLDVAEPEKADVVPDEEKPQVATGVEEPAITLGVETSDVVMTRIEPSEEVDDEEGVLAKEIFVEPGIEAELQAHAPSQDTVPTESSHAVAKVDLSEQDPEDFDALKDITAGDSVKLSAEPTTPSDSPEATDVLEVLTEITPIDLDVAEPEKADVVPDEEKPQVATGVEEPAITLGVETSDVVMSRIEPTQGVDNEDVLAKELFVKPGIEAELQAQAPSQDTVPTESSQAVANVDLSEQDPQDFDALKDITAGDSVKLSAGTTTPSDSPEATDVLEVLTEITPIDLDVAEPEKADVVPDEEKPQVATGVEEPAITLGVKTSDVVMTRIEPSEEVDDEEGVLAKEIFVEPGIEAELQAHAPSQDTVPTESSHAVAKVDLSKQDPEVFDALKDITAGDSVKLSAETTTPSDSPEATDVLEVLTEITPIHLDVAEPEKADVVPDEEKPQVATGVEEPAITLGVETSDVVMTRIEPSEEVDDEEGVLAKEIFVEPGIEAELQAHAPSQDTVPTESSHAVAKVDLSEQDPEDFDALKDITAGDSVKLSAEPTTPSDSPEATDVLEVLTEITPIDLDVAEPEKADVVPDEEKPQVATGVEEPAITLGVKTSDVVMTRIEPSEEVDDEEGVLAKEIFVEPGIEAELQAHAPSQATVPTESSHAVAKVVLSEQDPEDFDALKDITAGDSVKLSAETTTPSDSPEATDVLEVLTEITPIDLDVAEPEKADVVPDEEKPQVATVVEEPAITVGVKTSDVVMTRIELSEEVDDEEGVLAKEIFVEPGIEAELQAHAPSQDTVPTESSHAVAKVDLSEQDPEDFDALKDIAAGDSVKFSAGTTTPSDSPETTDVLEVLTEITPIHLNVAEPEKADVVPDEEKPQVATGVEEPAITLGVKTSDVVMTRTEPSEEVDDEEGVLAKEIFVEPGIEAELQAHAPSQDTVPTESSHAVAKVDLSEQDPEDFDALKDITAGDSVKLSAETTTPSDSPEATDVLEVLTEITPIDLDVAEPEKADVVPDEEKPQVATGVEEPAITLGVKTSDVVMTRIEPSEEVDDEEGVLAKEIFVEPGIEAELQAHAPSQDTVPTESSHAVAKVDLSEQDPEDFDALKDITAGDSVKLSAGTTTPSDSPEATDVLEVLTEITPIHLDVAEPEKADVVPDEEKPQVATGVEEPAITLGVKTSDAVMTRTEPSEEVDDEEGVLAKEIFVEPGIEAELQAHAPSQDTVPTESSHAVAKVDLSEQDPEDFDALKDITAGDSVKLSAETTTPSDSPEATDVLEVLTEITPIDLDVAEPEKADVVPDEEIPQVATGVEEPAITLGVKTSDVVMTRIEPSEEVDDEEGVLAKEIFVEPGIEAELQAHAPSQDTVPTESSHAVAKVDLSEQDPEDFDALKDITAGDSVKLSAGTTTPSDSPEATDVLEVLTEITPIHLDVAEPKKADVVPDEEKPQVATGVEEPAITLGVKTSDVVMTRTEPSEEVDDEEGVLAKEIFVEPGIEAELQAHAPSQDTVHTESSHAVAKVDLSEQDPEDFDALKDITAGDSVKLSAETTTPSDSPEATDVLEVLTEITPIDLDVAEPEKADVVPDEEIPQVATGVEEPAITLGVKTSDVVMTRIEPSEEVDDEEGVLAKEIFVEPGIEAELQAHAPSQDTVPTESSHAVAKVDLSEQDPEDFDALKDITAGDSVKLSAETTTPSDSPEATDVLEVFTEITPTDLDVAEPEKADVVPDEETFIGKRPLFVGSDFLNSAF